MQEPPIPNTTEKDYYPKNDPLFLLTDAFERGEPVFIRLEPGDMTRYDFYLIPPNDSAVRYSHGLSISDQWVFLAPVNLTMARNGFVRLDPDPALMYFEVKDIYPCRHTAKVVAYFLSLFAREVLR